MQKRHYDAAGHPCLDYLTLKRQITHKPSQDLLQRFLLCHLIVLPAIEIRVPTDRPSHLTIRLFGTGRELYNIKEIDQRTVCALRRFYKRAWRSGWSVHPMAGYVAFRREARVMLDPQRRY